MDFNLEDYIENSGFLNVPKEIRKNLEEMKKFFPNAIKEITFSLMAFNIDFEIIFKLIKKSFKKRNWEELYELIILLTIKEIIKEMKENYKINQNQNYLNKINELEQYKTEYIIIDFINFDLETLFYKGINNEEYIEYIFQFCVYWYRIFTSENLDIETSWSIIKNKLRKEKITKENLEIIENNFINYLDNQEKNLLDYFD